LAAAVPAWPHLATVHLVATQYSQLLHQQVVVLAQAVAQEMLEDLEDLAEAEQQMLVLVEQERQTKALMVAQVAQ
jgi:hypothetical protein